MCYVSRVSTSLITCGNLPVVDYAGEPKCIVMWACNPMWTNPDEYKGENFYRAFKKGAKLISIDPRKSLYAGKADLWLQLRPGTDGALAFGFTASSSKRSFMKRISWKITSTAGMLSNKGCCRIIRLKRYRKLHGLTKT
jgi:hypothetical protein